MDSFYFWRSWPDAHRRWWTVLALVFFSITALTIFSYLIYPAPVYTWQQVQELQEQEHILHVFQNGGFDFSIIADNYIVFERWLVNDMNVRLSYLDIYLAAFLLALIMVLSIVSALPRYWFLIGAGVLLFLMSTFQVEGLVLFGVTGRIPLAGMMILLIGPGIYFQFVNRRALFSIRLLTHIVSMAVFIVMVSLFSHVKSPLHYLALSTVPAAIVVFVMLCITVAHEIVGSFVWMSSQLKSTSGSLRHFLIISAVYMINLWLTYLQRIGSIEWKYGLPVFWLLSISMILSIWSVQQRRPLWGHIFEDAILPVYLTLSIGAVSMALLGFFYGTSNDAALLSVTDVVLFTHIGYGMMFFFYVLSNFIGLMAQNLPVYKVLYKPTAMPWFSFRLAGLIFTLALLFYNYWMVPVNHFISGYYTGWGDYYFSIGDPVLSSGYHKRAHFYASYNQHSALELSRLEAERGSTEKADDYARDANSFHPTEFTLSYEAERYMQKGRALRDVIYLKDALRLNPRSAVLKNTLGQRFARMGLTDSAFHYFTLAASNTRLKPTADLNRLGLLAQRKEPIRPDTLSQLLLGAQKPKPNIIALANVNQLLIEERPSVPKDSILNVFEAAEIGNFIINRIGQSDTTWLESYLSLARLDTNRYLKDKILVPAAHACYAQGRINKAFELLQEVIFSGEDQGRHNTTLALWCMDQGKPDAALVNLLYAINQRSPQAPVVEAVAQAETGQIEKSISNWELISLSNDTTLQAMAKSMIMVLQAQTEDWNKLNDKEKYQFARFRIPLNDTVTFRRMADRIGDPNWRARAYVDQARRFDDLDDLRSALSLLSRLNGAHVTDQIILTELKYFELRLLIAVGRWDIVEPQLKAGLTFVPYHEAERIYFQAAMEAKLGLKDAASQNFNWLGKNNPYFDDGIVAAARFFRQQGNKLKAYHILSEAIQVNGHSVKILKLYVIVALENGFDNFAAGALTTLKELLSSGAFNTYVKESHLEGLFQ